MYTPVETVIAFEIVDRFFQVGPDQPNLHSGLLMGQCVGKREKNRSARRTVISANKSRLKESVIMTSEHKNALLRVSGNVELADDVVHGYWPAWGGGHEIVGFNLRTVLLQNLTYNILRFPVARWPGPTLS